ncbi:MAG: hypothetical protein ACI9FJ_002280, partial [Alteromonadaceae bacterium]
MAETITYIIKAIIVMNHPLDQTAPAKYKFNLSALTIALVSAGFTTQAEQVIEQATDVQSKFRTERITVTASRKEML